MLLKESYSRIIIFIIILVALIRFLYLIYSPYELSPDEMYYWEWSRRLDYGYFSKPPLIAWIIWLSTKIFGNTEFAVRLPAIIFSLLSLVIIVKLLTDIYDIKVAFIGLLLTISTPATVLLSFFMTIDSPLVFFWILSLYFYWYAVNREKMIYWILLGISIGFGLLSKQTMILFYPCVIIYLFLKKKLFNKSILINVAVCFFISFLMFLPVIVWNFKNDFVTFIHTTEHFTKRDHHSLLNAFINIVSFILSQAILISPVIFVFTVYYSIKYFFNRDDEKFFFACFSAPLIIFVYILALIKPVNANWPAPFYISALFIVAHIFTKPSFVNMKKISLIIGLLLVFSLYSLHLIIDTFKLQNTKLDITKKLRNHRELAKNVYNFINTNGLSYNIDIASTRRMYVSALSFYLPGNPYVLRWSEKNFPTTQYEIWKMWDDKIGKDILFILDKKEKISPLMQKSFDFIQHLGSFSVNNKIFNVYYAKNYKKI